jgi:predicted HicB family RNase H-like nuclease
MNANDFGGQAAVLAARPYTITLVHDAESDSWTSGVLEVPGAISEGDDPNEAVAMVREALALVIEHRLRSGAEVPEPFETRAWSGELRLRLTPELHRRASTLAAEESVSLNRWLSAAVARASGIAAAAVVPAAGPAMRLVAEEEHRYGERTTEE